MATLGQIHQPAHDTRVVHLFLFQLLYNTNASSYADIDIANADGSEDECLMSDWTAHMVRGTWFSKNHGIFYYGLPPPLLDNLRRARCPILQTNTLVNFSYHLFFLVYLIQFFSVEKSPIFSFLPSIFMESKSQLSPKFCFPCNTYPKNSILFHADQSQDYVHLWNLNFIYEITNLSFQKGTKTRIR